MGIQETDPLAQLSLPPGFRFYPTDEELLVQYLCRKVAGHQFSLPIIGEIDLYKFDPWILPSKALFGEKEWYFFSPRDRKYPNGSRPNRVAGSGYWKATGTDKIITTEGRKVGIKKALVFYIGKAPKGTKTNWIMHEYRLFDSSRKAGSSKLDEWVLCRIYKKNSSAQKPMLTFSPTSKEHSHNGSSSSSSSASHLEDVLDSLPEIDERLFNLPRVNSINKTIQNMTGSASFDWASLAGLSSVPDLNPSAMSQSTRMTQGMVTFGGKNNDNSTTQDLYVPTMFGSNLIDHEVQSDVKTRRLDNSGGYYQQMNFTNNSPAEPFRFRYTNNPSGGFGYRQ
ncbi:hypothetical protein ACFE04_022490 [Oxalis oulophora]